MQLTTSGFCSPSLPRPPSTMRAAVWQARRLTLPSSWFVVDTPLPNAAVNGDTLMLSRGALESEHLPAVIAHELGHLTSTDGRLTAMLNRMLLLPPRPGRSPEQQPAPPPPRSGVEIRFHGLLWLAAIIAWTTVRFLVRLARGGLMLRLTAPLWGVYWREREYKADAYAANLGQADELADFLETHAADPRPANPAGLAHRAHPPTNGAAGREAARSSRSAGTQACVESGRVAPGSEPVKAALRAACGGA